eukprot:27478-Chlamydomonas_euryale.AAC.1
MSAMQPCAMRLPHAAAAAVAQHAATNAMQPCGKWSHIGSGVGFGHGSGPGPGSSFTGNQGTGSGDGGFSNCVRGSGSSSNGIEPIVYTALQAGSSSAPASFAVSVRTRLSLGWRPGWAVAGDARSLTTANGGWPNPQAPRRQLPGGGRHGNAHLLAAATAAAPAAAAAASDAADATGAQAASARGLKKSAHQVRPLLWVRRG